MINKKEHFFANTQDNLKEHCKSILTHIGREIGKGICDDVENEEVVVEIEEEKDEVEVEKNKEEKLVEMRNLKKKS